MPATESLGDSLKKQGVSRRELLRCCAAAAAAMALPATAARAMAASLAKTSRPAVLWLSFQECTGCTESLTRAHAPTLEHLILESLSLDYHHTLQAAAGEGAERARQETMQSHAGHYLLVVDGAVPTGNPGFSTIAGISNTTLLQEAAAGAGAIIAVGTCAAFGGLPMADPNPTGAVPISHLITDKPVVNIPGCPPLPEAMVGVLAHYLTFHRLPKLDSLNRPLAYFGTTIHDRCPRRTYYDRGLFAESFDDQGARQGWCLFKLGCKGPTTYNACATLKWNQGTSFPIQSGHGCLGCSQPRFWDAGGFYESIATPTHPLGPVVPMAAVAGAVLGGATAILNRQRYQRQERQRLPITPSDLEKTP